MDISGRWQPGQNDVWETCAKAPEIAPAMFHVSEVFGQDQNPYRGQKIGT